MIQSHKITSFSHLKISYCWLSYHFYRKFRLQNLFFNQTTKPLSSCIFTHWFIQCYPPAYDFSFSLFFLFFLFFFIFFSSLKCFTPAPNKKTQFYYLVYLCLYQKASFFLNLIWEIIKNSFYTSSFLFFFLFFFYLFYSFYCSL